MEGAEVLSIAQNDEKSTVASYRYENSNGEKFLVLNVNTREGGEVMLKTYERGRQYAEAVKWFSGKPLPAYIGGNPALYMQCKVGDGKMAVGLWNFFADPVYAPTVELDGEYTLGECIGCRAHISGSRITLSDIPSFGFVAFELLL